MSHEFEEPRVRILLALVAGVGLLASLVLVGSAIAKSGLPVGCGVASGCELVLASPFARVLGVSVAIPGAIVYAGLLAAGWLRARRAFALLTALAGGAGLWFLGLQLFAVGAICVWCAIAHTAGVLLLAITLLDRRRRDVRPLLVGWMFVVALAAVQLLAPSARPGPARVEADLTERRRGEGDRTIEILGGRFSIAVRGEPILGFPGAERLAVMLTDYCCPHCRATHRWLKKGLPGHDGRLAVLLLLSPLCSECNPNVDRTAPRYLDACALARLALAVHFTAPEFFAEFDEWLFESSRPRGRAEAKAEAARLIGREALAKGLLNPEIDRRLKRNAALLAAIGADRLPVIIPTDSDALVGLPIGPDALFADLLGE